MEQVIAKESPRGAPDGSRSKDFLPHPYRPYSKLLVNLCPTGMIPTREMTKHVPLSPAEVIEDVCRGLEGGASVIHLHARDENGVPTYRASIYEKMILGIRAHFPDAVIGVSCSGRQFPEFEKRSEVLDLEGRARPDLASLTLTSLDFPTGPSLNAPDLVRALARKMKKNGIKPELECFDFGMVNAANSLIAQREIDPPYYFNLLLGSRYSLPATARHLGTLVADLPADSIWSVAGIGLCQLPMSVLGIVMGGHCRIGLEDNIWADFDRTQLATNPGSVERTVRIAHECGRPIATRAEARVQLGLGPPPGD